MSEYELPLVFFTVLCQWAIGSIIAITLLFFNRPVWLYEENLFSKIKKMAVAIVAVNIVGSMLSMLHLGSPFGAYRAILGIAHSWLSREVLAFFLLNGAVILWAIILLKFNQNRTLVKYFSLLTSITGLAAIFVSAQVYYQMASHPMWHTPMTHINFVATALLLGFITMSLVISVSNHDSASGKDKIPYLLLLISLVALCLTLFVTLYYANGLNGQGEKISSAVSFFSSGLFGWFMFAGLITSAATISYLYKTPTLSITSSCTLMLLIFSASVCWRMLFYGSVMSQSPWF